MIVETIALLISIGIAFVLFKFIKDIAILAIHAFVAIVALWLVNVLGIHVAINAFSVLIVLLGGLPGLAIVILLHVLGIAF